MHSHRMTDPSDIKSFITAGKAYFTLRSAVTGTRYTYRSYVSKDNPNRFFIGSMVGPDNNTSYAYLGVLERGPDGGVSLRLSTKSRWGLDDERVVALDWSIRHIHSGVMSNKLEFWHEGRCGCCGRRLTVPESISSGIGPECARRLNSSRQASLLA